MTKKAVALIFALLWLPPSGGRSVLAAQWPQWRGPDRNGSIAPANTPAWPAAWKRAWRVDVGEGYSSPVVSAGRVFVHSRKDPDEIVTAIDLTTGKVAWQSKYPSRATEGRTADQAAILLTPSNVLLLVTAGELVLAKRSPARYEEERRYTVADSPTWAVPVVMKDSLIVRDASGVMRLTP